MGFRGFYTWERLINNNYEILFSRPSASQINKVVVDEMPEELNWIAMVDRLSGGDITKHNQIYETNYIECLNLLSYWHHRDRHVEQMNRAIMRKK
jgi:hypothetical protein